MTSVRNATVGDLEAVRHIFRAASLSNDGDRQALMAHPEVLELSSAGVDEGRTRVATVAGGRVVGFATTAVAADEEVMEIEDLFVHPDWMRRGIGTGLVQDIISRARERGVQRVEVTANDHALAFYGSVGFRVVGQVQTQFGPAPRMHLDVG